MRQRWEPSGAQRACLYSPQPNASESSGGDDDDDDDEDDKEDEDDDDKVWTQVQEEVDQMRSSLSLLTDAMNYLEKEKRRNLAAGIPVDGVDPGGVAGERVERGGAVERPDEELAVEGAGADEPAVGAPAERSDV